MKNLRQKAQRIYRTANRASGGSLEILRTTFASFSETGAPEAAASISYYAIFSLFPLLLLLITTGSFFMNSQSAVQQLTQTILSAIPVSRSLVEKNIQSILEQRGTVGIIGILGLLWSGMGVFTVLSVNINRSFPKSRPRSLISARLSALVMVVVLTLLLALAFLSRAFFSLLPRLSIPLVQGIHLLDTTFWAVMTTLIPWLLVFIMFLALYRFIPNTRVLWRQSFWGALIAASLWEIVTSGFTWYLGSGLARYEIVYGSLGAVVALMFYIYLTSWIVLFGAHLIAAIKKSTQPILAGSPGGKASDSD